MNTLKPIVTWNNKIWFSGFGSSTTQDYCWLVSYDPATGQIQKYSVPANSIHDIIAYRGNLYLVGYGPPRIPALDYMRGGTGFMFKFDGTTVTKILELSGTQGLVGLAAYEDYLYFGTFTGDVYRMQIPASSQMAVVRGNDNRIYYGNVDSSLTSWVPLPSGYTIDSPAAVLVGTELHMVVRGIDGSSIWHGYVDVSSGAFSGWTQLSGYSPSAPTLTSNGTHLGLVVRGLDDRAWYRFYALSSRTWSAWNALPSGFTSDSPAATVLNNRLHVVVRNIDGLNLWHGSVDLSNGAFSGWTIIGESTQSAPTLTAYGALNEIELVVRGLDNAISRNSWTDAGWKGWVNLPTGTTFQGPGASVVGQDLQVIVQGTEGSTIWKSSVNLSTGAFSGWTLLPGYTPSKPTLAG